MNTNYSATELTSISNLFALPTKESTTPAHFTPGSIGPPKQQVVKPKKTNTEDIWDEEQIEETVEDMDPRPQPEYTLSYSQMVSSEDMYLGMSGRTPSISHSDAILVSIKLPGSNLGSIEIHCRKTTLEVACPN
jgi:hypothetical protein